ncbi:uncharacterized protein BDZ99DRAFT_522813 [Mytilinidion resinicola]|uniref:Zn(2)-C6 fungal-type domain-containing protein n=1 Tax=Mytilinidion resinicola TaxID=574789 RepID=A0A6A6YEM9_9PEZI|nr:uncharacterized protein BDZ99DRAFT_522813 [Mytilinidion resinicola]KAF2807190.1 hypothetical protein BDZ99DRAFT_522813 [Mytilinidion resinicola]
MTGDKENYGTSDTIDTNDANDTDNTNNTNDTKDTNDTRRSEGAPGKPRKKVWKTKVKTGCITCRIRRVKCDEEKPNCKRCTSTGRKCDGYEPPKAQKQANQALVRTARPPTSTRSSPDLVPRYGKSTPATFMDPAFASEISAERQSLKFFQMYTAPEMAGFFDSTFWVQDLLVAAETHQAIRYAVTALGALHQKFIGCTLPVLPDDVSDQTLRFGLKQCNRSIQEIIKQSGSSGMSRLDRINAMTACVLFMCFASIQGHNSEAIEHLRGGLKLLRESDAIQQTARHDKQTHPVSMESLRGMFVTLDIHARGMISDKDIMSWEPIPSADPHTIPLEVKSLPQIRYYMEGTFNEVLAFLQGLDLYPPTTPEAVDVVTSTFNGFMEKIELGDKVLEEYLRRPTTRLSQEEQTAVLALKLHRNDIAAFSIMFQLQSELAEMAWDHCESQFIDMVAISTQLLGAEQGGLVQLYPSTSIPALPPYGPSFSKIQNASSATQRSRRPIFTVGFGVVISLFLVAYRSRHPVIRRQAISLLLNYPRREVLWDGVLAGRIARESMMMEETAYLNHVGLPLSDIRTVLTAAGDLPLHLRTRDIEIIYTGMRQANATFRSIADFQEGRKGVTKTIHW